MPHADGRHLASRPMTVRMGKSVWLLSPLVPDNGVTPVCALRRMGKFGCGRLLHPVVRLDSGQLGRRAARRVQHGANVWTCRGDGVEWGCLCVRPLCVSRVQTRQSLYKFACGDDVCERQRNFGLPSGMPFQGSAASANGCLPAMASAPKTALHALSTVSGVELSL